MSDERLWELEELLEAATNAHEIMNHCIENRCVPTKDEMLELGRAMSQAERHLAITPSPEPPRVTSDEWEQAIHNAWVSLPKASGREPDYGYYKVGFYDGAKWMQDQDTESRTSPSRLQTKGESTISQEWVRENTVGVWLYEDAKKRIADLEAEVDDGWEQKVKWEGVAHEQRLENERLKRAIEETQIGHNKTQSGNGDE